MKCIRTASGDVKRVEDSTADKMVRSGEAQYVSKEIWKKEGRKK